MSNEAMTAAPETEERIPAHRQNEVPSSMPGKPKREKKETAPKEKGEKKKGPKKKRRTDEQRAQELRDRADKILVNSAKRKAKQFSKRVALAMKYLGSAAEVAPAPETGALLGKVAAELEGIAARK